MISRKRTRRYSPESLSKVLRGSAISVLSVLVVSTGLLAAACDSREAGRGDAGESSETVAPPALSAELQAELETWLEQHGQAPIDYVLGLFRDHDIVLLGEQHRIRHDVELVQALVPRLQEVGVHVLAIEFARRSDQAIIDSVVTDSEWNEELAREVFFRQFMPWGYREYVDILKAVWHMNLKRPVGSSALRVVGLNNSADYSHYKSEADWDNPEVLQRVFGLQTEADWAEPVLAEVRRGGKVLAYCGIHHAFTGYRQPIVQEGRFIGFGGLRFGNHLRQALGPRVVTVYLHAPWNNANGYTDEFTHPADGRLDAFMLARQQGPFAVGFDVGESPLADLPISNAVYKHGYEPFTLQKFCDGWIYTKPVSQFEPVTYIENWITNRNVAQARSTAMNPRWRTYTVEQITNGCRSYLDDFRRFWGHLQ